MSDLEQYGCALVVPQGLGYAQRVVSGEFFWPDSIHHMQSTTLDAARWFGENVTLHRKRRGWTQTDLADALTETLGRVVGPATISRVESGERPTPVDEVVALAALLRSTPQALLTAPADVRLELEVAVKCDDVQEKRKQLTKAAIEYLESQSLLRLELANARNGRNEMRRRATSFLTQDAVDVARAAQLKSKAMLDAVESKISDEQNRMENGNGER